MDNCFSYRVPDRLLASLRREDDLMLSLGINEALKSEWCNTVVLIPKDGGIRFCIDFRLTKQKTERMDFSNDGGWLTIASVIIDGVQDSYTCVNKKYKMLFWNIKCFIKHFYLTLKSYYRTVQKHG